jgi:RNA polymerase sigma-70 factor (ECF subfamily)
LLEVKRLPEHRDRLFRAACALCRSREDAEDLVQETYANVLKRPRFVRRSTDDLAYLLRVLRNTWINTCRSRTRQPQSVLLDESIEIAVDHSADPALSMELRDLYEAIHQLSAPLRDTIVAVDIVGLSYKQAARALGTREGTIMSRLHRARSQVAEKCEAIAPPAICRLTPAVSHVDEASARRPDAPDAIPSRPDQTCISQTPPSGCRVDSEA